MFIFDKISGRAAKVASNKIVSGRHFSSITSQTNIIEENGSNEFTTISAHA